MHYTTGSVKESSYTGYKLIDADAFRASPNEHLPHSLIFCCGQDKEICKIRHMDHI